MPKTSTSARKPASKAPAEKPLASHLDAICDHIASGTSLRATCALLGLKESTVRTWLDSADAVKAKAAFRAARELGCDALADQIVEIADTPLVGEVRTRKPIVVDGKAIEGAFVEEVRTEDMLGHRKLQIDARFRLLGKWSPRYADKLAHTGPDGGAIKYERVERVIVDPGASD